MTTFKIFFNNNDIRRVTKEVTSYEQFVTFLEELYPQFHCELLIKYDDQEGDRIAVTSQMEWEEMMEELKDEKTIKLYITEGPNPRGYFKDGPQPESLHFYNDTVSKEPIAIENLKNLDVNVVKCLETFFRDGKIIPSHIPSFLKEVIGIKYLKNDLVDLDIDIARLSDKLHKTALDCLTSLDKEVIQKGRDYLVALVNLCPQNKISLYNLACAESLLNRVPEALNTLELAIRNGYDNLEHMLEDKDFDNIRENEGFMKLVTLINDLGGSFVESPYEDVCENCECNNKNEEKCCGNEEKCCGNEKKCCGNDDCGSEIIDEPVVLEYDSFQDSVQFNEETESKEPNDKKIEQLNNKLSESFIDLRSKYSSQISSIKSLGFAVDDEVLSLLLEQTNGNVEEVVQLLLENK